MKNNLYNLLILVFFLIVFSKKIIAQDSLLIAHTDISVPSDSFSNFENDFQLNENSYASPFFDFELTYVGEIFSNIQNSKPESFYLDNLLLGLNLDLQK